jgi:hypothetical protein
MARSYKSKESIAKYENNARAERNTDYYNAMKSSNLNGIFGVPYQFMDDVDPRLEKSKNNNNGLGAIYSERIFTHMPLLFLTPCKQKFMPEFTKEDQSKVLDSLLSGNADAANSISGNGRYYTTDFDAEQYYGYVNTMCREVACFLGIGDVKLPISNQPLKRIDWGTIRNSKFNNTLQTKDSVLFYLDGGATMDDSFSNSTTESALASTINGMADQVNELKFLLGESSAASALMELGNMVSSGVSGAMSGIFGGNSSELMGGMLADLSSNGIKTIVSGGKILFPKIWSNSEFDRSYNFNIKLRSPDHDSLSIYLNILVPYLHALAFVLPKQSNASLNGYVSPFLLRAYCKGFFNIDCGMVTSLSVSRGAEAQWNDDGLPTQMDISMTIEDLYSGLSMTSMNDVGDSDGLVSGIWNGIKGAAGGNVVAVVKNTAMVDYLANLAGLNVAEEPLGRRVTLATFLLSSTVPETGHRIWSRFGEEGAKWFYNTFYRKLN